MPPEITPDSIRGQKFRTVMRGSDSSEVARFQAEVAARVAELEDQAERLKARLGEFADRDLKSEFEVVGNEVTAVLEAAREAAASMRERASVDSAKWRSEAMAEAEKTLKDARNDAEALRGDAWTVGSEMLTQAVVESNRMAKQAEREAITITGEAEREAHRLVSGARREAEDLVRAATMDAEKLTSDATRAHDEMIEQARRQAETSQERTRALEQRREELMAELEGVRSTLSHLEGTLEAKREDLNLSRTSDSTVRVVPSAPSAQPAEQSAGAKEWVPGETVRVVRGEDSPPTRESPPAPPPVVQPTVRVIPAEEVPRVADENDETPDSPAETEIAVESTPTEKELPASTPAEKPQDGDDVGALFASLLDPDSSERPVDEETKPSPPVPGSQPTPAVAPATDTAGVSVRAADDLLEDRDTLMIPITNRALRGIKKAITEAQNIALDGLRTASDWRPSKAQLADTLRADLIALWSESFSAGHDMAETMAGEKLKRPPTPTDDAADAFVSALVTSLTSELAAAGDGQRERQSAASKVFRAWRTDEAERRIRQVSLRGFHSGLAGSRTGRSLEWIAAGTPCSACIEAAQDPASNLPPIHAGCECMVALA